jgi:hypothetical protein
VKAKLHSLLSSAALLALVILPNGVIAAPGPARIFSPVLPQLGQARIPVYVPSWVPHFSRKTYPLAFIGSRGRSYELDLSFIPNSGGTAVLAFYLTANIDGLSPGPHPRRVALSDGVTGYVGSVPGTASDSLTIRWRRNGVVYAIGRLGSVTDLLRCARSVVRVGG